MVILVRPTPPRSRAVAKGRKQPYYAILRNLQALTISKADLTTR